MKIAVCDDNEQIIAQISELIRDFFTQKEISGYEILAFRDGESLLSADTDIDILFLDIEMPGLDGIYVGNEIKKLHPEIITFIVTSYMEYLDEAMKFRVFRYLSKPIEKQRFFRNMNDAIDMYNSINITTAIETKDGVQTILTSSIVTVEIRDKKVIIYTPNQSYISVQPFQYWIDILPHNMFFRTHRSFIVNFKYITSFDHYTVNIINDLTRVYLTRRKYNAFKQAYYMYLESTR